MSESQGLDISRVISLIMENPQLIEQISALAKADSKEHNEKAEAVETASEEKTDVTPASSPATYSPINQNRVNRAQLLGALKPYMSNERAKAIDSMLTIADILDMMRAR